MTSFKLVDGEDRRLSYLRISITDRCNLRCIYCAPDGYISKLRHDDILTYEEMLRLVKVGVSLGIRKVRITGGEPLARKGVYGFIERLSSIQGLTDLSLTTNGVSLLSGAKKIKEAGINRLNISLDSLDPIKYKYITNYDGFEKVWDGIMFAHELEFKPIKINVVAMRGLNDNEFFDFSQLSFRYPFHIRFIEYMPVGISKMKTEYQILTPEIKEHLSTIGNLQPIESSEDDGPARRFKFDGALGELGFISAVSQHFCDKCNRLRLTAAGDLRSCLLSDVSVSLKGLLRKTCSDEVLAKAFIESARHKGVRHCLAPNFQGMISGQMYTIGG